MQKYWTLLKLLSLGIGLAAMVYLQRSPEFVSVRAVAGSGGKLAAIEINGLQFSIGRSEGDQIAQHFWSSLALTEVEHPWIQLQIDDELVWREAIEVLELVLSGDQEPRVSIVEEFSEDLAPEQNLIVYEPDVVSEYQTRMIELRQPGALSGAGSAVIIESGSTLSLDQLSDRLPALIGEPGSQTAESMLIVINAQAGVPFREVRAVLKAVAGRRSTWTGKWQRSVRHIRLDSLRWQPRSRRFQSVKDALTSATPKRPGFIRGD